MYTLPRTLYNTRVLYSDRLYNWIRPQIQFTN